MDLHAFLLSLDPRVVEGLIPGLIGAICSLVLLGALRLVLRIARRGRGPGGQAAKLLAEARSVEAGLRELAQEVEGRLDEKIGRLERLLGEADAVCPPGAHRPFGRSIARGPEDDEPVAIVPAEGLPAVTAGEREKVLALAALGKRPEMIAETVGLPRGEVDLILRLHRLGTGSS